MRTSWQLENPMKTTVESGCFAWAALNAPFTTLRSFPPMFDTRSWKTGRFVTVAGKEKVKTK